MLVFVLGAIHKVRTQGGGGGIKYLTYLSVFTLWMAPYVFFKSKLCHLA